MSMNTPVKKAAAIEWGDFVMAHSTPPIDKEITA